MEDDIHPDSSLTRLATRAQRDETSMLLTAVWLCELVLDTDDSGGRIEIVAQDGSRSILDVNTVRGFQGQPRARRA